MRAEGHAQEEKAETIAAPGRLEPSGKRFESYDSPATKLVPNDPTGYRGTEITFGTREI